MKDVSLNVADVDTAARQDEVRQAVREGYKTIAETGVLTSATAPQAGGCCGPSGCCGGEGWSAESLAVKIGYDAAQIAQLPEGANMGLSCGNPTAIAGIQPGETVVDLGSGGGFDCFLAGPKTGAAGRVIGVDMTPEMLSKARKSVAHYRKTTGLDNVEFRLGEIEHLPIADGSADLVISNCVINLSPNKAQVWREISRVLQPGGRVAVSDIALLQPLPSEVVEMVEALVGCVAGAVLLSEYQAHIEAAGLREITVTPKPEYVATLEQFQDPLYERIRLSMPAGAKLADYIASVDILARK